MINKTRKLNRKVIECYYKNKSIVKKDLLEVDKMNFKGTGGISISFEEHLKFEETLDKIKEIIKNPNNYTKIQRTKAIQMLEKMQHRLNSIAYSQGIRNYLNIYISK